MCTTNSHFYMGVGDLNSVRFSFLGSEHINHWTIYTTPNPILSLSVSFLWYLQAVLVWAHKPKKTSKARSALVNKRDSKLDSFLPEMRGYLWSYMILLMSTWGPWEYPKTPKCRTGSFLLPCGDTQTLGFKMLKWGSPRQWEILAQKKKKNRWRYSVLPSKEKHDWTNLYTHEHTYIQYTHHTQRKSPLCFPYFCFP